MFGPQCFSDIKCDLPYLQQLIWSFNNLLGFFYIPGNSVGPGDCGEGNTTTPSLQEQTYQRTDMDDTQVNKHCR